MASSFNMKCVANNFKFLLTGLGKGFFNIFCGVLIQSNPEDVFSKIVGWTMVAAGCLFLFLSKVKKMSDEDLHRALSVMEHKDEMKDKAKSVGKSTAKAAGKAAYNNKEVIAKAAVDN